MFYTLLRSIVGVALRWFYSRIDVDGLERVPPRGPALLAVNHPNAMIDAWVVGLVLPRRILITAKATLFSNPLVAAFLRAAGVVPLIRAQDVAAVKSSQDARRNERAFAELINALARGQAILMFPEGITGDHPSLAPLRTGTARLALQARDTGIAALAIVPIGLTFERKDTPRTRVFVHVGTPIDMDAWPATLPGRAGDSSDVAELTAEIDRRLHSVTLNFPSAKDAERATTLAALFARLLVGAETVPPVSRPHAPLGSQVLIARRIEAARARLESTPESLRHRVDALIARLSRFNEERRVHRVAIEDLEITLDAKAGTRFVLRELPLVLLAGPVAFWGWVNHWLPFQLSRLLALRSIENAADPAMRTVINALVLVLLFYVAQASLVFAVLGPVAAALYLVSLPLAADVNFYFGARLSRALRRARTYLLFRRRPQWQRQLADELRWLRAETVALDQALYASFTNRSATESMQ